MDYAPRKFSVRACMQRRGGRFSFTLMLNKLLLLLPLSLPLPLHTKHSRFHTRFYVAFLPSLRTSASSSFSSGVTQQHRLPTPDGGQQEVVEARFVHPLEALAEHRSKKIALMPPQHYIITTLADLLVGPPHMTTPQQRECVEQLSTGTFGRMVICPQAGKRDANGRTPLVYEGDEARGGPRGRLHRSIVTIGPETKVGWSYDLCS